MADADQDIRITLTAIDAASGPIREVQAALEKLGTLNLGGLGSQMQTVGTALESVGAQMQALAQSTTVLTEAMKTGMAAQTAEVVGATDRQRAALSAHAQAAQSIVQNAQSTMTAVTGSGGQERTSLSQVAEDALVRLTQQGAQQRLATMRSAYKQETADADAAYREQFGLLDDLKRRMAELRVQGGFIPGAGRRVAPPLGIDEASPAMAAAAEETERALEAAEHLDVALKAAGASGAQAGRQIAAGMKEAEGGMLSEKGLLGEKGPVGGGFDAGGAIDLAKQFIIWGALFEAVSRATGAVRTFASGLISTNASYEDLEATLTTLYGSSGAAQRALDWLDAFAEKTPATREQVRQAGVSFAAVGDNIGLMVPAAERLSTAMRNEGGLGSATQAIVDAQFGRTEMLRQNLKLTIPELEKYGLVVEHNGHMVQGTFIPAIERMTGVLNDQYMKTHNLTADPRFINSIDLAMKTLSGTASNLGDIFEDTQRRMGAGLFKSLETWLAPIVAAMGDPKGAGAVISSVADSLGRTLGAALKQGLDALTAWWDRLGGLPGLIRLVNQAWSTFTGTIKALWPVVQGVGDAIGVVWDTIKLVTDALGTFFGAFGHGGDVLRTVTATIVTLGLELKLMATVLGPLKALWEGLTAAIGLNTVAEEANAAAAGTDAAAQEAAGGSGLFGRLAGMAKGPGKLLAAEGPVLAEEGAVAAGGLGVVTTGLMGLATAALAVIAPIAAVAAGIAALGEMSGGWASTGEKRAVAPFKLSEAATMVVLPTGTPTPGAGGILPTGTPTPGATPSAQPAPVAGQGGGYATGPSVAAQFAQTLPRAGQDAFWNLEKGYPQQWMTYIAAHPDIGRQWVAANAAVGQGTAAQNAYTQAVFGTAPATPAQQAAQLWQSAGVSAQIKQRQGELYGDLYQLQTLREQQDTAGGMTDPKKIAADIARTVTAPFMKQFGRFIPKSEGGSLPDSAGGTTPADQLAQASQAAQQQVGFDEVLKVPYKQFKHDMDVAVAAMRADPNTPADAIKVFYKQHTDQWNQAQAQLAQNKLSVDEALHKPYAQISADLDDMASKLAAEGDTNDQIVAKLDTAIKQYFDGLIQASQAQLGALQTLGVGVPAQLAEVSHEQDLMRQANERARQTALKHHEDYVPLYTPEEIVAAGITGEKNIWGQNLQTAQQTLQYHEAIGATWATMMGDVTTMATDGRNAHMTAAQLFTQTTQSIQQAATSALSLAQTLGRGLPQTRHLIDQAVASYAQTPGVTPDMAKVFRTQLDRQYLDPLYQQQQTGIQNRLQLGVQTGQVQTPAQVLAAAAAFRATEHQQPGESTADYNARVALATNQILQTGFAGINARQQMQFDWDTGPGGNVVNALKDERAIITASVAEWTAEGMSPGDIKLHRQMLTRTLDQQRQGQPITPEPHYQPYGHLGQEPGFGAVDLRFGNPMTNAVMGMVSQLQAMVTYWKSRALHDEKDSQNQARTAANTQATVAALKAHPFPAGAVGPPNTVAGVRRVGGNIPV